MCKVWDKESQFPILFLYHVSETTLHRKALLILLVMQKKKKGKKAKRIIKPGIIIFMQNMISYLFCWSECEIWAGRVVCEIDPDSRADLQMLTESDSRPTSSFQKETLVPNNPTLFTQLQKNQSGSIRAKLHRTNDVSRVKTVRIERESHAVASPNLLQFITAAFLGLNTGVWNSSLVWQRNGLRNTHTGECGKCVWLHCVLA